MAEWKNSSNKYGAISKCFHWLMAFLVCTMFALGWGREIAPGPYRSGMIQTHIWLGISILALFWMRLTWRTFSPPPLITGLTKIMHAMAQTVHWVLYLALLLMPLSGWLMVSAMGRNPTFFGLFNLPPLIEKDPSSVPFLKDLHSVCAWAFLGLIAAHVLAALYHHFVIKDDTLKRMLP